MPVGFGEAIPMRRYLFSSLGQSLSVLLAVLVLVFFMVRITGDPAALMMSKEATQEQIQAFRHEMGFDRPLDAQFVDYLAKVVRGDFGDSLHYKVPALPMVAERLPATLELAFVALFMSVIVAVPLGLIGGSSPGSKWDFAARTVGLFGQATPSYWLALMLILVFAVQLGWFPTFGRSEPKSVILPAFALSISTMGSLVRLTRSAVLEVRQEDYVRTAYSKGLSPNAVYVKHVLQNVAIPLVSVIGIQFGFMLGGSIYIEAIFAWPGMGRMVAESVSNRDFPLVQAIAFFTSIVIILLNLLTDLAYGWIDPRIRYGQ
jgi:ABC-type dipeptide/oligopeptide/nickel transport system permease component